MFRSDRLRVLFVCTGNTARSQMAEAILRSLSHGAVDVSSGGGVPQADIHPMARAAMAHLGIDMAGQRTKSWDQFAGEPFDYVITVCDRAAETCPVFPGARERLHWSFEDPAAAAGTPEERQRAFDDVASQLMARLQTWLSLPEIRDRLKGA